MNVAGTMIFLKATVMIKNYGAIYQTQSFSTISLQARAKTLIKSYELKDGGSCNWLLVSSREQTGKAVMIYKIINNGLCPENPRERLITRSNLSNYPA